MTTWYGGHGWGWCGMMLNIPAMVLLWGAAVAAVVMATRLAVRRPGDPPDQTNTGRLRPDAMAAKGITPPRGSDSDEFYRRLM